jgi:nicotinamidase-related amidase
MSTQIDVDELPLGDDHHAPERRGGPDADSLVLQRESALLLVVDVQERLVKAMPPEAMAQLEKNIAILIKAARRLELPLVVSEQYRKGLGLTIEPLRALLGEADAPVEKLEFSCGASKEIARRIFKANRRQVIVAGMETHVCVFQTVRDLQLGGYKAFVPQDAVISRTQANKDIGLKLMEKAGATLTSTEATLFDLLGVAGTPEFKELAPLIK